MKNLVLLISERVTLSSGTELANVLRLSRMAKQAWPAAVQACLQDAERLRLSQRPWAAVRDPIAALVLTLQRIGWQLTAGGARLRDELGCEFDVLTFSPVFLAERAREATRKPQPLRRPGPGLAPSGPGATRQLGGLSTSCSA